MTSSQLSNKRVEWNKRAGLWPKKVEAAPKTNDKSKQSYLNLNSSAPKGVSEKLWYVLERYAKNPQFFIRSANDCTLMFSMTQLGGRLPIISNNEDKQYSLGCINLVESGNEILRMLHQKPFFKPNIQFISSN